MALAALAHRAPVRRRIKTAIGVGALLGLALFYGDGMLTPAISVLSAVEGIGVGNAAFTPWIMPVTLIILIALFMMQSRGTAKIGRIFGPVMVLWFVVLAVLGALAIARSPQILRAIDPAYGVALFAREPWTAFVALGSVVLAVTGCEALYADMGHFGRWPIQAAWLFLALPCLIINYLGQGAFALDVLHRAHGHPVGDIDWFFQMTPEFLRAPMVIMATAATVIASQAVITGAFSMTQQAMQLGLLPRMILRRTSETAAGQIYLPQINMFLAVGVVLLIAVFKTSDNLGQAYGLAVTGTMVVTTSLAFVVVRRLWRWPLIGAVALIAPMWALDVIFLAANSLKLFSGAAMPLVLGGGLFLIMATWVRGGDILTRKTQRDTPPLLEFLGLLKDRPPHRVPGTAVYLTGDPDRAPGALLHNLKHNKVLHERVLFLTVNTLDEPEAGPDHQAEFTELSPGIFRVLLRYGFMDSPNIPRSLEALRVRGLPFDPMQVSYFLGREMIVPAMVPKMPWWRLWLFLVMARNAVSATEFFRIPSDRVVELGVRVAI